MARGKPFLKPYGHTGGTERTHRALAYAIFPEPCGHTETHDAGTKGAALRYAVEALRATEGLFSDDGLHLALVVGKAIEKEFYLRVHEVL